MNVIKVAVMLAGGVTAQVQDLLAQAAFVMPRGNAPVQNQVPIKQAPKAEVQQPRIGPKLSEQHILKLVTEMGDAVFAKREAAQSALEAHMDFALVQRLAKVRTGDSSAEVRRRADLLVEKHYRQCMPRVVLKPTKYPVMPCIDILLEQKDLEIPHNSFLSEESLQEIRAYFLERSREAGKPTDYEDWWLTRGATGKLVDHLLDYIVRDSLTVQPFEEEIAMKTAKLQSIIDAAVVRERVLREKIYMPDLLAPKKQLPKKRHGSS